MDVPWLIVQDGRKMICKRYGQQVYPSMTMDPALM
jgi:hypothetical protein